MNFIILHGIQGHAGIHWQQWLHDRLEEMGHSVLMPELPHAEHPDRQEWLRAVTRTLEGVDPSNLVIVGHSLGVATALDFIEQSGRRVHGLVSASEFAVDYGAELNSYFMSEKQIDMDRVRRHLEKAVVLYGDDDPYVTQEALKDLAEGLHVGPIVIPKGGHLNAAAGFTEFPRLLQALETIL